jgi:hypothetical protein
MSILLVLSIFWDATQSIASKSDFSEEHITSIFRGEELTKLGAEAIQGGTSPIKRVSFEQRKVGGWCLMATSLKV